MFDVDNFDYDLTQGNKQSIQTISLANKANSNSKDEN